MLFSSLQCSEETLATKSVVEDNKLPNSPLSQWIQENFTQPYNIEVKYQWQQESTYDKSTLYPPKEEKAQHYLKALKYLWIDLYKEIAGQDFIKTLSPYEIKLFGGANIDGFGVERMQLAGNQYFPVSLFNIDEFEKDSLKIKKLTRNIQNHTAKLMILKKPFDKEKFAKLNTFPYILSNTGAGADIYTAVYPSYTGFYSIPATRYNVEEDFAETFSVLVTTPRQEINRMIESAATPTDDYLKEVKRAENARRTLEAKRNFVTQYLNDEYNINIDVLTVKNLIRMQNYLNQEIE